MSVSPTTDRPNSVRPLSVPAGFLWGASTAAHQIEGNNTASDWWHLETTPGSHVVEPSGDAADSYHRWAEDMDILVDLGLTDYRFSIEWARIEPTEGRFSNAELAHYRRMVDGAIERGLRPVVTLHHFTVPQWFAARGGWTAPGAVELFVRYVERTAPVIGTGVSHVCTINEPNMVAMFGAIASLGAEAFREAGLPLPDAATTEVLVEAHHAARAAIKAIDPQIQVGWTIANQVYQALPGAEAVTAEYSWPREDVFLVAARDDDWVGVQSYTRTRVGTDGPLHPEPGVELTLSGYEFYPQAVGEAARHTWEVTEHTPVIVTENGLSVTDDTRRVAYLHGALDSLERAMADGVDIRGYLHWSLLDNYEWGSYAPTFGLVAVDRETFERHPKPSAHELGRIAQGGAFPRP
ncbi:beta-glucosidase/6-phospho-beta-glucosidase/beta-galactosidase [Sanguibacter keddieii DSM 10542]|uniref:Beta-glucosidase/6-phospho-beta-glucosidase/beta-galactosidase n=1 Tax=Sanguibacter keddieii (strain ATCC 51767 / DSM 10542 / NCFB 3025 / ST-74) TaxID=446469 RepID=D1BJI3_SANKS|nr:family 1 glycosylhydrolase [Sanguibacter keddieii]ACZ20239.1 beta-glucosidase/6-phospho-beta-glucosidase/beta-galactosidase [Sanguibacter keddieii DSM 10542]